MRLDISMSITSHTQEEIIHYIRHNPIMVLSTINSRGMPQGAAIYAYAPAADKIYFVTKTETEKYQNLIHNPNVSLTSYDGQHNSTLQAEGTARIVDNAQLIGMVMQKMTRIYAKSADWLPPIAKISAGPYQVIEVTLHRTRLGNFQGKHAGNPHIYQEN